MDELSQQRFEKLLASDINALNADDRAFLRARRAYISREDRKRLQSVLKEAVVEPEEEKLQGTGGLRAYQILKKRAKGLGIDTKGLKIDDMKVAIRTIEGPGSDL